MVTVLRYAFSEWISVIKVHVLIRTVRWTIPQTGIDEVVLFQLISGFSDKLWSRFQCHTWSTKVTRVRLCWPHPSYMVSGCGGFLH